MQFGRIDGNAYTLDFQYPFSAVQAFAVALANVTQRLKWKHVHTIPFVIFIFVKGVVSLSFLLFITTFQYTDKRD